VSKLNPAAGPERGAQFSLLGLLIATTLIAAAVGGLEALRPTIGGDRAAVLLGEISRPARQVRELVLGVSVALAAIGGLWVVARPGAIWFRLAAVLATIPVLAGYLTHLAGVTDERTTAAINLALSLAWVAGLTGFTILPLRLLDYRLMRRAKAPAAVRVEAPSKVRQVARWAAVAVAVTFLVIVPVSYWSGTSRTARKSTPTAIFAAWIQPPRPRIVIWDRLMQLQISIHSYSGGTQLVPKPIPAGTTLLEISNDWEYRVAPVAPEEGLKAITLGSDSTPTQP
jgi:hypothetical protein